MNAEGEETGAEEVAAAPDEPASWNVSGQAQIDRLVWSAQPLDCPDAADGDFCVELTVHNPSDEAQTVATNVSLVGMAESSPMARMPSTPNTLQTRSLELQALPGQTVVSLASFTLPEVPPFAMHVQVGPAEPWAGVVLASYVGPSQMDWGLSLASETDLQAITF